jgi:hypothetical protein
MARRGQAIRILTLGASLVASATFAAPSFGAAPAPVVSLEQNGPVVAGKPLAFTASTSEKLGGAGQLALELRGLDLTKAVRSTYARPDYSDKPCMTQPCRWTVTASSATRYEFRAFLVNLQTRKELGQSPPVQAVWTSAAATRPMGIKLLFNGRAMPKEPLIGGREIYREIATGKTKVEARWTNDARGYQVVISTVSPQAKEYVRCLAGTSCVVPKRVWILPNQEITWSFKLLRASDRKLVQGFKVCLVGRA